MFTNKIGIDLGTANTLIFVPKKGIVINEPSVVAISLTDNKILAIGNEAKEMLGRTPDSIVASRPLKDGVIADFRVTEAMIRYFIRKALGSWMFSKPEVLISVPAGITSTEKRAVIEAAMNAGAKAAYVVKEPILAAIGAGIPINTPSGNMIINIGGGTTEVAVISLGGVVVASSVRVGGDKIDKAIAEYIKKRHGIVVGERTAEEIKIAIGSALPVDKEEVFKARGRDLSSGLPRNIEVRTNEVALSIGDELKEILQAIKNVLQETPPELSADIMDKGIVLSGGGAQLKNLDDLISQEIGVAVFVADDPIFCVAKGTGAILDNLEIYKRSIMARR